MMIEESKNESVVWVSPQVELLFSIQEGTAGGQIQDVEVNGGGLLLGS